MKKVCIPLFGDDVAPRFDLAPEALIAGIDDDGRIADERTIVLSQASADALCRLILDERIALVVCGAIEDEYYQYLTWKKVKVVDSVIGSYGQVLDRVSTGHLKEGDILNRPKIATDSSG